MEDGVFQDLKTPVPLVSLSFQMACLFPSPLQKILWWLEGKVKGRRMLGGGGLWCGVVS